MDGPQAEYQQRLSVRRETLRSLERRDALYANGRLVVFVIGLALAWAVFGPLRWPTGLLAVAAGVFIYLVVMHEWTLRQIRDARQSVRYYELGLLRIQDEWSGHGNPGLDLQPEGHIYAEDLDIFGEGSLFELLCAARTRSGEEILAKWLCQPTSVEEVVKRQEAVRALADQHDLRELQWIVGGEARPRLRPELMIAWAQSPRVLPGVAFRLAAVIVTLAVVAATIAWMFDAIPARNILIPVLPALLLQWWLKDRSLSVLRAGDEPLKDLQVLARIARHVETAPAQAPRLRALQDALQTEGRTASAAIGRLAQLSSWQEAQRNAMFAPFAIALLWNVHFAYAMESWRARYGGRVSTWLKSIGEFEALCSLSTYAYEHPDDVFPDVVEDGPTFHAEEIGHLLLPGDTCVRNSIGLDQSKCLLMVSGSNMSGKSTLLRTVGVNAVLALCGSPVRAKALRISPMQIGASMHIVDSIQRGTSHFYAEILRLRDILDATRGPMPVLFLVDEILHGTNSHDRSIGSHAVLQSFIEAGAVGLVTTHDLALTKIVSELGNRAANVHFVDHLENGKLVFDYKMQPGVVERSNALALMRSIGLDV